MTEQINVLTTTDIHGFIANQGQSPALTLLGVKQQFPNALLIDSGDFFVGNPLTTFFCDTKRISPMVNYANEVGYDVMVPGNHDFDHGIDYLKEQVCHLAADYVCCNVFSDDNKLIFSPYTIKEITGIKVGIIGLLTSRMSMISDYDVTTGVIVKDALPELQKQVAMLRDQVDLILVGYHGGLERDLATGNEINYATGEDEAYKLVSKTPGIAGFSCGHQHRINHGRIGDTLVIQGGYRGNCFGHMTFTFDNRHRIITRQEQMVMTSKLPVKTNNFYSEDEYQNWLHQPIVLDCLIEFLRHKFARRHMGIFISLKGQTRQEVISSFTIPYGVRIYHLNAAEYQKFKQQDWTLKAEDYSDGARDFVIMTNSYNVPEYRLTEQFVDNIFDEYSYYLKQRN